MNLSKMFKLDEEAFILGLFTYCLVSELSRGAFYMCEFFFNSHKVSPSTARQISWSNRY